jgi:hypothetical protein
VRRRPLSRRRFGGRLGVPDRLAPVARYAAVPRADAEGAAAAPRLAGGGLPPSTGAPPTCTERAAASARRS